MCLCVSVLMCVCMCTCACVCLCVCCVCACVCECAHVYVLVCIVVCVCCVSALTWVWGCRCPYVQVQIEAWSHSWVSCFTTFTSVFCLDWLTSDFQGSFCLCLPEPGLQAVAFYWALGLWIQFLILATVSSTDLPNTFLQIYHDPPYPVVWCCLIVKCVETAGLAKLSESLQECQAFIEHIITEAWKLTLIINSSSYETYFYFEEWL